MFNDNKFDWNSIVTVPAQELSCYPDGVDLTGIVLGSWWNIPEGSLIRVRGTNPVYQISGGEPHWLQMSEQEFYSFGYRGEMIQNVDYPIIAGSPIYSWQFTVANSQCKSSPPPAPVLKANGQTCGAPSECASKTCFPAPWGQDYCINERLNCVKPGADGSIYNERFVYNNNEYTCVSPGVLVLSSTLQQKKIYGEQCSVNEDCESTYCFFGPDAKKYCIAADKSCGLAGTEGLKQDQLTVFGGVEYRCAAGNVYVPASSPLPRSVADGGTCRLGGDDCASRFCYPFPDGKGYCINERKTCARPGTAGLIVTETTCFGGLLYECKADPQNLTPIGNCP